MQQKSGKGKGLNFAEFLEVLIRLGLFVFGGDKAPDGTVRSDVESVVALRTLLFQAVQNPRANSSLRDLRPLATDVVVTPLLRTVIDETEAKTAAFSAPRRASVTQAVALSSLAPELLSQLTDQPHDAFVQKIFAIYSSKNNFHSTAHDGSEFETVSYDHSHLDQGELLLALKHFNVVPQWASKEDVLLIYYQVVCMPLFW
jgi:hypothetical protein